ncbi:MAG: tRNA (guanosine(46)-N7)-methyltransferase TrmB [Eubacterium sp.]|nr:tRNA (guanosine(46)-N7)-methyltransferase TrmB [Eubacterium sp.]
MHIRPRPWARPELLACGFFVEDPRMARGAWQKEFAQSAPLHLELGCGKGSFIAALAHRNPEINYLAIDMIDAVLGLSKRNIEAAYAGDAVDNLRLTAWDIERITDILAPEDAVERIYINFCNPWPKRRQNKKRLTYTRQLERYRSFCVPGCEIHFKTDSDLLFDASLKYFEAMDFESLFLTRDLHREGGYPDNIVTEHEKMFSDEGIPIKMTVVKMP